MAKGKKIWFPKTAVEEIEKIKIDEGIITNHEAIRKLVKHAQVGRELDKIRSRMFPFIDKKKKR